MINVVGVASITFSPTPNSISSGSCCERGGEQHLAGQEQHDELRRRIELRLIRLASEPRHVVAHLARMVDETLLAHVVVVGLRGLEIRRERRLRVDDDVEAAGQADHDVGPLPAIFAGHARLLDEVAMLDHPGHLDDAAQLQLAPAPAAAG